MWKAKPILEKIFNVTYALYTMSYLVSSLQSTIVSNVLSQRVPSIQRLLVDAVVSVLLHHALGLLLKGLYRRVLPPQAQVSILVIFPPFEEKGDILPCSWSVWKDFRGDCLIKQTFYQPWSSKAWVSSCPITTPMPPKLRALKDICEMILKASHLKLLQLSSAGDVYHHQI